MDPDAYLIMAHTEDTHWWFCARRAILKKIIEHLQLTPDAKILEIGSGTGGNLGMLRQFGAVSALEMDVTARNLSVEKYNNDIDIRVGNFPTTNPFQGRHFDLICLFDVLEHIDDDEKALTELKSLLSDRGKILITVPAYQWMWSIHDESLHHKRRYTRVKLFNKLSNAGFAVLKLSYFNMFLFPLAVLMRIKDRISSNMKSSGTSTPGKYINHLLQYIFSVERHILTYINLPFGLSLIAIIESHNTRQSDGEQ